jgi:carbon-monoxide dehydrogenase small subunit
MLVNSCLTPVGTIEGRSVLTIEGYRETERFKVIERSFADAGAVQCGFCIPGMVMAVEALLNRNNRPSEVAIREAIAGNLCHRTGYTMIVEAVQMAAERGGGLW